MESGKLYWAFFLFSGIHRTDDQLIIQENKYRDELIIKIIVRRAESIYIWVLEPDNLLLLKMTRSIIRHYQT